MERRYESCTLSDLADLCGETIGAFQKRLLRDDLHEMIRLGWWPFARKLPPSVVKYLRDRFIDQPKTPE